MKTIKPTPPEMKFKIIKLPKMIGKSIREVKDYLEKTYPNKLATEEDQEDFIKSNPKLPDLTWCLFFGSLVRISDGRWFVPAAGWGGSKWYRYAYWLDSGWYSNSRVVLLEISKREENKWYITGRGQVVQLPKSEKSEGRRKFLGAYNTKVEAERARDSIKDIMQDK